MVIKEEPIQKVRTWLPVRAGDTTFYVSYPAFKGTHVDSYTALSGDKQVRPATGREVAIIGSVAYTNTQKEWQAIRSCFADGNVRIPHVNLWIPKGSFKDDEALAGVVVAYDSLAQGRDKVIPVPNLSDWKQNDHGIYISPDRTQEFVPENKYTLGEQTMQSMEHNGFAIANLTQEGACLVAKTAMNNHNVPYVGGLYPSKLEKSVSGLYDGGDRFGLNGDCWNDKWEGFAFGVSVNVPEEFAEKKSVFEHPYYAPCNYFPW